MESFLWHDYETWGVNPAVDRPAQFAAIRTDLDLNPIGEAIMLYARPAADMLPDPDACLITGITPQYAEEHGLVEAEFIGQIHAEMIQPGTCSVGFNSIRFDDEVTRYTLYRNFHDPYEREWKNGNSRWDMIDVLRLCAAVRPEGINWPVDDDGLPSFRLEKLTAANHIEQHGAHDALVDVRATIDVARMVKERQPKLFSYALTMRNKNRVAEAVALGSFKPLFHISGMFGSKNHCASIILPLCMHPINKNAVICFDLRESPAEFLKLSAESIRERVFSSSEQLGDKPRIALKNIHLNKSPMVAPVSMVDAEVAARIQMDLNQVRKHYDELMVDQTAWLKARDVFSGQQFEEYTDPDAMLYSGGFFSNNDKATIARVSKASPQELAKQTFSFEDARLPEMLFRYRARNYPETLNEIEQAEWQEYRFQRLTDPASGVGITMAAYQEKLEALFMQYQDDHRKAEILGQLMDWGDAILG